MGMDALTSKVRFTFGITEPWKGIDFVGVTMGLFAIPEILVSVENWASQEVFSTRIKGIWPNRQEFRQSLGPMVRGSVLGFFTGIIPGGGPLLASFFSYALEKSISKHPERFGTGTIEGVAGPEAANNSGERRGSWSPSSPSRLPCNVGNGHHAQCFHHVGSPARAPLLMAGAAPALLGGRGQHVPRQPGPPDPEPPLWSGSSSACSPVPYRILLPFIVLFCVIGAYAVYIPCFRAFGMMLDFGVFWIFHAQGKLPLTPVVLGVW